MEFLERSLLFLAIFVTFLCSSQAYVFYVGGRKGWSVNPSEEYNHWAERNRFQVNDTLVFKYEKGHNSVLVVSKEAYSNCNVESPIQKFADGNTEFKFDRSGPFFFIAGNADSCRKGQRLIVVVLALRNAPLAPTPAVPGKAPTPSPLSESPEGSTSSDPSPAPTQHAAAPAPHAAAPALAGPVVWVLAVGFGVSMVLGN